MRKRILIVSLAVCLLGASAVAGAAENPEVEKAKEEVAFNLDVVWTCIAAFLVFFMQAGFAMVEAGFTRAKNAVNILMKNLMDFSVGSLAFFLVGFGLMFGTTNGLFGTDLFAMAGVEAGGDWRWTFLIFQTVFAATAATIVSGAMAERTKFVGYLAYSVLITMFIYPIFGSWAWGSLLDGSGWLEGLGFADFAGSTVVHSIGGWLALAGAIVLGPRLGKYSNGKPQAIVGHNIPLAALGVFILWLGWFGFNPGSTTAGNGTIGYIAVTTNLAAAAGAVAAMITSWTIIKKPDASMSLNGALAGLVAITAGCDGVSAGGAIVIGLIAGILVVLSVIFIDSVLKIDDPVGAVSVHGVCGVWGTLAVGLFNLETGLFYGGGIKQLGVQMLGSATAFVWAFGLGLAMFYLVSKTIGLRVSPEEELKGLDIGEHGMEAYGGFQIFSTT
jgi:Amt family ammonium transporter